MGDADLKILNLVVRWPGSSHDQTIFNNSKIHAEFDGGKFGNLVLLGDSGYAVTKYMMTPIGNPTSQGEHMFNESQIRTRNPIERLFGVWKRRFPALSVGLRVSVPLGKKIIIACAILHNIAILNKDDFPLDDTLVTEYDQVNEPANEIDNNSFRLPYINYFLNLLNN